MAIIFATPPSLTELWAEHAQRVTAHGDKPLLRGLFVDCQDTAIDPDGNVRKSFLDFMRDTQKTQRMEPYLISKNLGPCKFLFWAQSVKIDDLGAQGKKELIRKIKPNGALLEMLVDDKPEQDLPALTTIHPDHLSYLLRKSVLAA